MGEYLFLGYNNSCKFVKRINVQQFVLCVDIVGNFNEPVLLVLALQYLYNLHFILENQKITFTNIYNFLCNYTPKTHREQ